MAPRSSKTPYNEDASNSSLGSQDSVDMELMKTAKEMSIATKKRREAKRNKIESDRVKRIKEIRVKLDALFENRKIRRTKIQQDQWAKLSALNKKREALEAQILGSMSSIERHTMNMARELDAMFVGRLEGLKEIPDA